MTHKVHPKIYRVKVVGDWDTRGFYENPAYFLEEDFRIREFLKTKLATASVEKVEIERYPGKINIIISSARPGLIIGRGGEGVEQLKKFLVNKVMNKKGQFIERLASKNNALDFAAGKAAKKGDKSLPAGKETKAKTEIRFEIREIKNPWVSATLIGQWVAQQIERRIPFRRVLKQTLSKTSANKEIQGVKVEVSGRLDGNEIARREWLKLGRLPLQTLRSDIDFAKVEAHCTYGNIGIKIWLYKGEKFE